MKTVVMAALAWLATVSGSPVVAKPALADSSMPRLLAGAELREVGVDGQFGRIERIEAALLEGRCVLVLRTSGTPVRAITIRLGGLHFVQGDNVALLDIATRSQPRSEYILDVGEGRYRAAATALATRAKECGAKLVGPPPLVTTTPR